MKISRTGTNSFSVRLRDTELRENNIFVYIWMERASKEPKFMYSSGSLVLTHDEGVLMMELIRAVLTLATMLEDQKAADEYIEKMHERLSVKAEVKPQIAVEKEVPAEVVALLTAGTVVEGANDADATG